MKKIDIKSLANKVFKNSSWLFFAGFLVLVLFEIFEINTSVQIILNFNREVPPVNKEKGVRINFDNYNQALLKIQRADTFEPTGGVSRNPFQKAQ